MPNLGYDMEAAKITAWLKKVGDPVRRGELIAEIETDKATIEMEALRTERSRRSSLGRASRSRSARWSLSLSDSDQTASSGASTLVELSPMRRAIARRMAESKRNAPHFYTEIEIPMARVGEYVQTSNAEPMLHE